MQKGYRTEVRVTMQQKSKAHRTGSGRWEEGPGSAITVGRGSNKGGCGRYRSRRRRIRRNKEEKKFLHTGQDGTNRR